jgi:hypothetical protein
MSGAIDYLNLFTESFLNHDPTSNLGKIWKIISTQIDEVTVQLDLIRAMLDLDTQTGITLDYIGAGLNQARAGGQDDDEYRIFLKVALVCRYSGGNIDDLVTIGQAVDEDDPDRMIRPYELPYEPDTIFLDGDDVLDGADPLSPSEAYPASVVSKIDQWMDDTDVPTNQALVFDSLRAGGIFGKFHMTYNILESDMTAYAGDPVSGTYIALGDGRTGAPGPGDTGLENEVYRAACSHGTSGVDTLYINISEKDLNDKEINEIALFDVNLDLALKASWVKGISKNSAMIDTYQIILDEE